MSVNLSMLAGAAAQFLDNSGNVLTGGKLYTYAAGTTTPQATYTSSSGATPHSNPIILDAAGRVPAGGEIWLTDLLFYKFLLKDSNDVLIGTYDNISGANDNTQLNLFKDNLANSSDPAKGDALVGFRQSNSSGNLTGSVARTVHQKFQEFISVLDFGAVGDGITNDTAAIQAAINTQKSVYFPKGTYLCNVSINNKTVLFGDGSTASVIKPFSYATPAMVYTFAAMQNPEFSYWNYHTVIRNLGFKGTGAGVTATGIGFSLGATSPSNYVSNAEFATNVTFYNCKFEALNKGVQFPFGNIGASFYSCSFADNYYGIYNLSNFISNDMHAGCKYVYDGEAHGNVCAFYWSGEVGGAIVFKSTIIENNKVGFYFNNSSPLFNPVNLENLWIEANGQVNTPGSTVIIDLWTAGVQTSQTITANTFVFAGTSGNYNLNNCFFTDTAVTGTNIVANVQDSFCESNTGGGGAACSVTSGTSCINMINPSTDGGLPTGQFIKSYGLVQVKRPLTGNASSAVTRWWNGSPRISKIANYGVSKQASIPFTAATLIETSGGAVSILGSVVSDGVIYSTCNEYTGTAGQLVSTNHLFADTALVTMNVSNWYVVTFDAKIVSGNVSFNIWDLSLGQVALGITCPTIGSWYSFAAICYAADTYTNVGLDVQGTGVASVWKMSAYQIHKFGTLSDAQAFLNGGAYTE